MAKNFPFDNKGISLTYFLITQLPEALEMFPTNIEWAYKVFNNYCGMRNNPKMAKGWSQENWDEWEPILLHCMNLLPPREGIAVAA